MSVHKSIMTSCLYQTFLNTTNKLFLKMRVDAGTSDEYWCFYIHIWPQ